MTSMMIPIASSLLLLTTAATAQISSYNSNNPIPIKGDPDKIVCQAEQKIGTRLSVRKVCLTVREWQENASNYQEQTQRMQSQACVPLGGCGGITIGDPVSSQGPM